MATKIMTYTLANGNIQLTIQYFDILWPLQNGDGRLIIVAV